MPFSKRTYSVLLKTGIGIFCVIVIGHRLYGSYTNESPNELKQLFSSDNILLLLTAFMLLFVNWGIEVYKWNIITAGIEKISFYKAWQSVWMGVCIGNLTPGRLGEFAGRMMFFKPENRAKVTTAHFVSGISQLTITIMMGAIGVLGYLSLAKNYWWLGIIELTLLAILILALAKINTLTPLLSRISFLKRFDFEHLQYNQKSIWKLLVLSSVRYIVFFTQFYVLLLCCGIQGDFFQIASSITLMYLLLSTIPMISFVEIAIRAFITVMLFNSFHISDWQLSLASTLLWFINLAIPSLIGYYFLIKNNFTLRSKDSHAVA